MITYTLEQVSLLTNLTTRTLRTYIKDGFLQGDKSSGKWMFTSDQFREFTNHPAVIPALQAKKMAIVTDFLNTKPESGNRMCVILDVKEQSRETTQQFLKSLAEMEVTEDFSYSSDRLDDDIVRFIVSGSEENVMDILCQYQEAKRTWV